jgi:hypothetical protein
MADIELVIKIPETLKRIADEEDIKTFSHFVWQMLLMDIVKNGTPLPKGHGDLIDRKKLLKQPMDTANYPSGYVKIAPTIIEADKGEE